MAKMIKNTKRLQVILRQRKYPWDKWLNGKIWCLTPGVDFHVGSNGMNSFRSLLTYIGRRRGGIVHASYRKGKLYIAFTRNRKQKGIKP